MVELKYSIILQMLRASSSWSGDIRLHVALPVMLISDVGWELHNTIYKGLRAGRYHLDSKLLKDLYAVCPKSLRPQLIHSGFFSWLGPAEFERPFVETYRRKRLTVFERRDLALSLEGYLWSQPTRADKFAPIILELLRSPEWEYRLRGLMMVGMLSDLAEADCKLILQALRDKSFEIRCQACNGLCNLAKRRSKVSPRLRAFCMSPEIKEIALGLYKRDPTIEAKTCAYYFLKAREPRAGHKPPKGMPVPPPRRKRRKRA